MKALLEFILIDGTIILGLFYVTTIAVGLSSQFITKRVRNRLEMNTDIGRPSGYVLAAMLGAVTPFCSATTIPVFSGFLRTGIYFGYAVTFLVASPIINEIAILALLRYKGVHFAALFVLLAVLSAGIIGYLFRNGGTQLDLKIPLRRTETVSGFVGRDETRIPLKSRLRIAHLMSLVELKRNIRFLVLGIVVGGTIYGFVPSSAIYWISRNVPMAIQVPAMAVIGAPLYLNLLSALPIAFALVDRGVSLGPITAFLIAGAGLSITEVVLLSNIFRLHWVAKYVLAIVCAATAIGFIVAAIYH